MTLMEIIADIRQKYNNNELINTAEYTEIIKFINNPNMSNMVKNIVSYTKVLCCYKVYNLKLLKSKNKTYLYFKDMDNDEYNNYIVK